MSLRAVIQAGGKGARLRPYTTVIPKPLMPVDEMPILEVVIRQLAWHGISRITITTGHLSHLLRAFFGDGRRWGVAIDYVLEPRPLGTVGAVRLVRDLDETFLMMNGDLLTDIDYTALLRFHRRRARCLTIATCRKSVPIDLGVIECDSRGEIAAFREKPVLEVLVSMGIYVLEPAAIDLIPRGRPFGFDDLMAEALRRGTKPAVYPFRGRWLDIGRPSDYEVATATLREERDRFLPSRPRTKRKAGATTGRSGRA